MNSRRRACCDGARDDAFAECAESLQQMLAIVSADEDAISKGMKVRALIANILGRIKDAGVPLQVRLKQAYLTGRIEQAEADKAAVLAIHIEAEEGYDDESFHDAVEVTLGAVSSVIAAERDRLRAELAALKEAERGE